MNSTPLVIRSRRVVLPDGSPAGGDRSRSTDASVRFAPPGSQQSSGARHRCRRSRRAARVSSTPTSTSTIRAAPSGKASSTRRVPPQPVASRPRRHAAEQRASDDDAWKDWRQSGRRPPGSVMWTSDSGAASCLGNRDGARATRARRRSRLQVLSVRRLACRSSSTWSSAICARPCRSSRGSACRCSCTRSCLPSCASPPAIRGATRPGANSRPPAAEEGAIATTDRRWHASSRRRVHIVHLAAPDALPVISAARAAGTHVTVRNLSALPDVSPPSTFLTARQRSSARRRFARRTIATGCGRDSSTVTSIWSLPITRRRPRR